MFSIGARSVSTADGEPRSSTIRSRPSIESGEPSTPSSETRTISAREDREHREVGQRRGVVGEVLGLKGLAGVAQRVPPGADGQVGR